MKERILGHFMLNILCFLILGSLNFELPFFGGSYNDCIIDKKSFALHTK